MITDSMTYQEIADAIRKDWESELYSCYVHCFGMRQKYGRFILKNVKPEEFRFLGRREKLTKNRNKYVFLFYTHGRTQYKHEGPLRSFRLEYLRKDGIHAVKVNVFDTKEVTFYTPHFFDRYRERFLEKHYDVDYWTKEDVMDDYFMYNAAEVSTPQHNPKYPEGIFVTTEDGVILGVDLGDGIWEYRTFISFEMLKGGQIDISNEEENMVNLIKALPKNMDVNKLLSNV